MPGFVPGSLDIGPMCQGARSWNNALLLRIGARRPAFALLEQELFYCGKELSGSMVELEGKVGAPFEHEKRYEQLCRRQSEIEEKLDLTKNQAPSQVEADLVDENEEKNSRTQHKTHVIRPKQQVKVSV